MRDEAYRCAIAAVVHRIIKFGVEPVLAQFTSRDCLTACLMCGTEMAEMFMRVAFTRALVEDEQEIIRRLLAVPFIPESRLWLAKLGHCVAGSEEAKAAGAEWLAGLHGEELSIASLLVGRVHPDLVGSDWLVYCDESYPRLCAEICLLMLRKPEYETLVKQYLRKRPHVFYSVDDARWPVSI